MATGRPGQRRITHVCVTPLIITIAAFTSSVAIYSVPLPLRAHVIFLAISHSFTAALVLHRAYTRHTPFGPAFLSAAAVLGALAVFSLETGVDTRGLTNALLLLALVCPGPLVDTVTGMAKGSCGICSFAGGSVCGTI